MNTEYTSTCDTYNCAHDEQCDDCWLIDHEKECGWCEQVDHTTRVLKVQHLPSDYPPSDEALADVRADLEAKYKGL